MDMFRRTVMLAALAVFMAGPSLARTIAPGETWTMAGTISALEAASGTLVVEAPIESGSLTVGVTMEKGAPITRKGIAIGLADLKVGEKVTLTYTRRGDQLIGLRVRAR